MLEIAIGGGITGNMQINDTDIHLPSLSCITRTFKYKMVISPLYSQIPEKGYQQNYSPSTEKYIEVLKGHLRQKGLGANKRLNMGHQVSERWDILEIVNYITPRINCVGKETVHISGGLTSYFVKILELLLLYKSLRLRDRSSVVAIICGGVLDLNSSFNSFNSCVSVSVFIAYVC